MDGKAVMLRTMSTKMLEVLHSGEALKLNVDSWKVHHDDCQDRELEMQMVVGTCLIASSSSPSVSSSPSSTSAEQVGVSELVEEDAILMGERDSS
ncbi:hypothetical protein TcWFU_005928 [Taenia crassiceps]|uniref:Uncharacterized protein n=1 Tax=Taenia crassiceps TaxID=6207 RepID=A0ABR4QLW5_9CEST